MCFFVFISSYKQNNVHLEIDRERERERERDRERERVAVLPHVMFCVFLLCGMLHRVFEFFIFNIVAG